MHGEAAFTPSPVFGLDAMTLSTLILVATYAVIISERINRAIVALLGAGAMVLLGVLNQQAAIRGIDFNTIALLVGMMVIVAITKRCGVFQFLAIWSAKQVQAHPAGILAMLQVVTAVLSAMLDNVTTVLLIVPVTLVMIEELKLDPYPFLFGEIFASNVGGTSTLIGDPPNILIGSAVGLTFNQFIINLMPIAIAILIAQVILLHYLWGRRFVVLPANRERIMQFVERDAITDWRLLKQSLLVIALVIIGFVFAHQIGAEPGTTALTGAALLMLLDNLGKSAEEQSHAVHQTFGDVEWVTIFFFIGLFIVVAGVEHSGFLKLIAEQVIELTGGDMLATAMLILWGSAVASAVVDNIPFVATMIPLVKTMAPTFGGPEALEPIWWSLALGACLGGNGTLVGASANLTVAGLAERAGYPIGFVRFMWLAFPMMIASIVMAAAYVYFFLL